MHLKPFVNASSPDWRLHKTEMAMALVAKLATYPAEDRREARSRLWLNVPSELAGAEVTNVIVHDLSRGGLLVQADALLEVGSEVAIEMPEVGAVAARVVWSSGSFFGCQFAEPISESTVSAALSESRVVYPDFPLPTGTPPLRQSERRVPAMDVADDLEAPASEAEAERGSLSVNPRVLGIIAISLLLWGAITWAVLSFF
jgi:hypothetical protein